jgi:hypothetical protein
MNTNGHEFFKEDASNSRGHMCAPETRIPDHRTVNSHTPVSHKQQVQRGGSQGAPMAMLIENWNRRRLPQRMVRQCCNHGPCLCRWIIKAIQNGSASKANHCATITATQIGNENSPNRS